MNIVRSLAKSVTVLAALAGGSAAAAQELPHYHVVQTIPLGLPDKWDFLFFDSTANRVYVSHRTQVDVVDLAQGKVVGVLPGLAESHGVVTVPALGRGYADDGAAKSLIAFDLQSFAKTASAATDTDSDAVVYDPATRRVFVMNADGNSVSAVDSATNATLKTVPLNGAPESAAADGRGKLFINLASTGEVVAFDANTLAVSARYKVPTCTRPHGMGMDTESNRLFISCANAVMIVVDAATGATLATLPIGKGTDAAAFDNVHKLAFSANSDGTLSVIAEKDANTFVSLGNIATAPGAKTLAVDPKGGRIFLVTADVTAEQPGATHHTYVPGTAKLLVLSAP